MKHNLKLILGLVLLFVVIVVAGIIVVVTRQTGPGNGLENRGPVTELGVRFGEIDLEKENQLYEDQLEAVVQARDDRCNKTSNQDECKEYLYFEDWVAEVTSDALATKNAVRCVELGEVEAVDGCLEVLSFQLKDNDICHRIASAPKQDTCLRRMGADSLAKTPVDSDNDGISDDDEINLYGTNPNNPDSDGDSFPDGVEIENGFNPLGS